MGVIDTTSGLTVFEGSCPIERASIAILGTRQQDKAPGTGSISGMSAFEGALVGAINGADLTPFSADSGLVIMNKVTGQIEETIILPRNFFIEDVTSDEEGVVLVSVTEGVSAIGARGSIYELRRMA